MGRRLALQFRSTKESVAGFGALVCFMHVEKGLKGSETEGTRLILQVKRDQSAFILSDCNHNDWQL
ncbi:MAG: hypothetical protein CL484_01890 [Acidobacteria bacterium]|nr:hypothetical protein [Acidobacteriota bacterium]